MAKTLYTKRYVIVVPAELCEAANAAAVEATGEEADRLTWQVREEETDAVCGWTMKLGTAAKLMGLLGAIGPAKDKKEIALVDIYGKPDLEAAIVEERAARRPVNVDDLMI
jgi:hypothetical protein